MLFHQIQLMVCAILAQRYANQAKNTISSHCKNRAKDKKIPP